MISSVVDIQSIPGLDHLAAYVTGVGDVQVDLTVTFHQGRVGHGLATVDAPPGGVPPPLHHGGQHGVQV